MRFFVRMSATTLLLAACGGNKPTSSTPEATSTGAVAEAPVASPEQTQGAGDAPDQSSEFVLRNSGDAGQAQESTATASKIRGNKTHAAMKLFVVDKEKGPIPGIVIVMTAPDGTKFYSEETNADGYTELLVPNGQKYEIVYLSLGRKDIAASVPVTDEPNQNIKLTLRYKRYEAPRATTGEPTGFVLYGVEFDTGKATIRSNSFPQLDGVADYMLHKKSARIEISGHTDNVGKPKVNKALSQKRAEACRDYLISKGVEADRVQAVGYGDERPVASNDTEEGRQQNRRIEASEL